MAEECADMRSWLSPLCLCCVYSPSTCHQWCDGMHRLHWNSKFQDLPRPGKWPGLLLVWMSCFASQGIFFLALIALSEILPCLEAWQRAGGDAVTVGHSFIYFKMKTEQSEFLWIWHEVRSCVCPLSVHSLKGDPKWALPSRKFRTVNSQQGGTAKALSVKQVYLIYQWLSLNEYGAKRFCKQENMKLY